jgi:NNP family nitrate/nitrite transporter-like MFS transporter
MVFPGLMLLVMAFVYYKFTKDSPNGNFDEIGRKASKTKNDWSILKDWRVWALSMAYAVCFGMEITFDGVASLHFVDTFKLSQSSAGFWAGVFGFMNIFARALGGIAADKIGHRFGMKGKGYLLAAMLLLEGIGLIFFANAGGLTFAIISMLSFALFLKMANGATYAIVPFVNEKNVGLVAGVVGAGGNVGGMLFGFLFKSQNITYVEAFKYIGFAVIGVAAIISVTNFYKQRAQAELVMEDVEAAVA